MIYAIKGIMATRKAVRVYEINHKDKVSSWHIAHHYYPINKPCIICGIYPSHRHHPNTKKPREIIFLCPSHHKQAHQSMVK